MNKRITSADLAAYVGVSRSAVSRAFTDGASINKDKRDQILKAAKELGYQPNFFARTLSTPSPKARSHLVAILISDFSNPYQSHLFEQLSTVLQKHGKQPMLLNVRNEDDLATDILRLSGYQVDGVVAVMGSLPAESLTLCLKLSLPLVILGRSDTSGQIASVQTDNICAGELAADHFIANGLTRLGFLAGRKDGQASNERYQGFFRQLQKHGIKVSRLEAGRYGYKAGFEAGKLYRSELSKLEGLFCASDALALGLIDSCRQLNHIDVPNQLRIIGCDNVPQAEWYGYQLTTVAQPVMSIAEHVYQLLAEMWHEGNMSKASTVRLKPKLIVRAT